MLKSSLVSASSSIAQSSAWLRVVRVENAFFWAELIADNTCATASCGAGATGCHTNALARLFMKQPLLKFSLPVSHLSLAKGDQVLVCFPERRLMFLSLLTYGVALISLLLGVALGQFLGGDGLAFVFGCLALLISWFLLNRHFLNLTPQIQEIRRE
jgi:positive regulator of sigma E activity